MTLDNEAPEIYGKSGARPLTASDFDDNVEDPVDAREIFDLVKDIKDPEHPLTLEELNVVKEDLISYDPDARVVTVEFSPTINRCSMAPLIGLSIIVKLLRTLPDNMKLDVRIKSGTHDSEEAYNKQLNDKERVAAALENSNLLGVINACIHVDGTV
uniref:Mitotic spindle-associated MMXD complex subunit MIP18 n=2 Tax=Aceria tosichella TaxID=561515 RepID=A0A6G1SNR6_9ACAR